MVRWVFGGALALLLSFTSFADVQTDTRVDEVHLEDGTVVDCVVLMETSKGVLIVELDPEDNEKTRQRVILKTGITRIVRGKSDGSITGFQTDAENARKVILAMGYRQSETKKSSSKKTSKTDTDGPQGPAGPVKVDKPALPKDVAEPTTKPVPKPIPDGPAGKIVPRDLADAYLTRFPELRDAAQTLLGVDRVPQVIEQALGGDTVAMQQLESFVKPFLNPKPGVFMDTPAAGPNGKPAKGFNKRKTPAKPAPAKPEKPAAK